MGTKEMKTTMKSGWLVHAATAVVGALAIIIGVRNATYANHPVSFLVPNFLMFTPFRAATLKAWDRVLEYDTSKEVEPVPIPEMNATDFTFDALRQLTHNFRSPAIVRGMFANTAAVEKWPVPGYMAEKVGNHRVNAIQGAYIDVMDSEREAQAETFAEAYQHILLQENSTKYLFFPDASSDSNAEYQQNLVSTVNELVRVDLDLDRLWNGFGLHSTFQISQIIVGRGRPSPDLRPTGSNWHCAIGNNWFAQVAGSKRWYFLDQKHSPYVKPMRADVNSFFTGAPNMQELQKYLPLQYADLEAGDLLYNPDFMWHTVVNHKPGLTIGVPIREFNLTLAVRNNLQFTAIVAINNLFQLGGVRYGFAEFYEN